MIACSARWRRWRLGGGHERTSGGLEGLSMVIFRFCFIIIVAVCNCVVVVILAHRMDQKATTSSVAGQALFRVHARDPRAELS